MTDPADIEATILRLLEEQPAGKTISPVDAANTLSPGPRWHLQMPGIRRAAIRLALDGRIVIYRKGKPADPNDFKGRTGWGSRVRTDDLRALRTGLGAAVGRLGQRSRKRFGRAPRHPVGGKTDDLVGCGVQRAGQDL